MMRGKNQISVILIKNAELSRVPITDQTQKIRNRTNMKIREFGNKYYQVKGILDRMNIKRDALFYIGKELEKQYKNQKKGIHIQTQCKRMKEALHCWYCEHFYKELTVPVPSFINKLISLNINYQKSTPSKIKQNDKSINENNCYEMQDEISNNTSTITNANPNLSILSDAKINQEIDCFDLANATEGNVKCYNEDIFNPFMNIFHT